MSFFSTLEARATAIDSLLCVGLDPHPSDLPAQTREAVVAFCVRLIDATKDVALAYKPNIAFFEAVGAEGHLALEDVIAHIPDGIPVLLDNKRGDIGSTAEAYAKATFETLGAHCMTASPYLGSDSLAPFLKDPARGCFVLCKTSNPSSSELQSLPLAAAASSSESKEGGSGGEPQLLYEKVATLMTELNTNDNVGLVVGATDIEVRFGEIGERWWAAGRGWGWWGWELLMIAVEVDGIHFCRVSVRRMP